MQSEAEIFTSPPRAILIVDQFERIRMENHAYEVLVETLQTWGLEMPLAAVCPDGRQIDEVFNTIDAVPPIENLDRRFTLQASFCGIPCELGVRQVQLSSTELGRAIYWRRYGRSELAHQVVLSGLIIHSTIKRNHHLQLLTTQQRTLLDQFNQLASALIRIDRSTNEHDSFNDLRVKLAEEFKQICLQLFRLLSGSQTSKRRKLIFQSITDLLEQHRQSLEYLLNTYQIVKDQISPLKDAYGKLASDAWQGDLLAHLVWLESARSGTSPTIAQLSQNLSQFAKRGLSTADAFHANQPTLEHKRVVKDTIALLNTMNRSVSAIVESQSRV